MADINEMTDAVLDKLFGFYCNSMPEFAEGEEPDTYAVYSTRDKPVDFASGIYLGKSYWVSLSIISLTYDRDLYRQVEKAFVQAGFTYSGGTDLSGFESTSPYPHRYRYVQEYLIDMEE